MLKSSTFYWLFISLFCCSFYGNFFYNLYKTFGETFIEDDFFLAMAFSVGSVANALARIGWGLLTDKSSFQVSYSTFNIITITMKSYYCVISDNLINCNLCCHFLLVYYAHYSSFGEIFLFVMGK